MNKHKMSYVLFCLAAAFTMAFAAQGTAAAAESVKLGAILNLTTAQSLYGTPMVNGVKLAVEHINAKGGINGRQIELLTEDAADTATTAMNAYNRMMEKKPLALVGPILGFQMIPFREKIDKDQIPMISLSGTRGWTMNNNKYGFRTAEFDGTSKPAMADFVVEKLGAKKVGIITTANEWGYSGRDHVSARLKTKYGITPTLIESYQVTDKDMSAQLLNLKKAGVDVIVSQGHPADNAILFKQYKQLNIGVPLIACSVAQTAINMDITQPEDVEGIYVQTYALPWDDPDPTIKAWAQEFNKKFKSIPDAYALAQYDGVMIYGEAMKRAEAKGNLTRQGITDEMWKTDYKGMIARYVPDMEGNMMRDYIVVKYGKDKKAEIVGRVTVKQEDTIYALPK